MTAAAPPPRDTLKSLARDFVCPETLPSDAARMAAVRDFVVRYGRIDPASTIAARLGVRDRLLAKRGCRPESLIHTFPEQ